MPTLSFVPQIWSHIVAALVAVLLAGYMWPRRSVRCGIPFLVCQLVLFLLFLLQILVISIDSLPHRISFYQIWSVLAIWGSLAALWFAVCCAGLMRRMSRTAWASISLPLLLFSGLILTNATHGWVWTEFRYDSMLQSTLGPAGQAGMLYAGVVASISVVILIMRWKRTRGALRWQAALLIPGLGMIGTGLATEVVRTSALTRNGASAVFATAGLLVVAVALFKSQRLDLAPIARHAMVEQTGHGVLVLDEKLRVVDLNPAAQRFLGATSWKVIGQDVHAALSAWPDILRVVADPSITLTEITIDRGLAERIFEVSVSPLPDPMGICMGRLILWLDVTENKAAQAQVDRQRSALAALAERERIGRELHDGLAQVFGYIKVQAQASLDAFERDRPETAKAGLGSILIVAQEAHDEIREFLLSARPAAQAGTNFWGVVTDFVERYRTIFGLNIDLSMPEGVREASLDPLVQVQLLRIVAESLGNVRKHSGVSRARLDFARKDAWLQVTVHDDGVGFDPSVVPGADKGRYGLCFMRERAATVGGWLDVISEPGQGTTVCVQVPVAPKDGMHATAVGG